MVVSVNDLKTAISTCVVVNVSEGVLTVLQSGMLNDRRVCRQDEEGRFQRLERVFESVFFGHGPSAESRVAARLRSLLGALVERRVKRTAQLLNTFIHHHHMPMDRNRAQYICFLTTLIFNNLT